MPLYDKYKDTFKNVSNRNYRKRHIWLREQLEVMECINCEESETICLMYWPHHKDIISISRSTGLNEEARKPVLDLIKDSIVVCSNCYIKLENDILDPIMVAKW
jgi:hypothetical protein